ncbi:MAG: NPCBM/NEW2 domain-containing protein, partial [Anaerolineales bacterium]
SKDAEHRTSPATSNAADPLIPPTSPALPPNNSPGVEAPGTGASVYLADLEPVATDLLPGAWTLKNVTYNRSLGVKDLCSENGDAKASYVLRGQYRRFRATAGPADDTVSGRVTFVVILDSKEIASRSGVHIGQPVELDLDVRGGARLDLILEAFTCGPNLAAAWGDPRLDR